MHNGYQIIDICNIENNPQLKFIRIQPTDIKMTLREVFNSLSNLCWIDSFDQSYMKNSYKQRAERTIAHIANNIITGCEDKITEDSGEYVVSELARKSIVETYNYLDIPLAELFKKQKRGNPGFDFYTENTCYTILFGEAKYKSHTNAHASALNQLNKFEQAKSDIEDLVELKEFCSEAALINADKGQKGYIAAFSATQIKTSVLIRHIVKNNDFKALSKFNELICVAINL